MVGLGSENGIFCWFYNTIYADVGGWVGLKKPKTCWRNTWMVPYWMKGIFEKILYTIGEEDYYFSKIPLWNEKFFHGIWYVIWFMYSNLYNLMFTDRSLNCCGKTWTVTLQRLKKAKWSKPATASKIYSGTFSDITYFHFIVKVALSTEDFLYLLFVALFREEK